MQKYSEDLTLKKIAVIRTDFPEKFGLPRQSGLAETRGKIVFEPEYRSKEALRGLEDYSHLWLLWGFSEVRTGTRRCVHRDWEEILVWAYLPQDLRFDQIQSVCRAFVWWKSVIRKKKEAYYL